MQITDIVIYPVKACRGIQVDRAQVTRRGLKSDRRWMLVDADGHFLTQRTQPRLALVSTAIDRATLVLRAPDAPELRRPLVLTEGKTRSVVVWEDRCDALVDASASGWFSEYLGIDCEAVFMPESSRRAVDPKYSQADDIVSFADGYPLLVATEASLRDLSARVGTPMSMERFRPNLVVDGDEPYAEDHWTALEAEAMRFRAVKRCSRCKVTTIDPATGAAGKEPLRTLATYRTIDSKVYFGMNLIPDGEGEIRRGETCRPVVG
ncbi:MAG: MOSC N-terminal beta barrel domain-containing protein [Myxococcota bacterium]